MAYRKNRKVSRNLPSVHSQWESKYVNTGDVAWRAPSSLARIKPSRFGARKILTFGFEAK